MLGRYINTLLISGFLGVSMRLEPRCPNVFIVDLQRIMPENISIQKPDWKFEGLISFRWRDIQKTNYSQCITLKWIFQKDSSFRGKQMSQGSDFFACMVRAWDHTSKIFWPNKFQVWGCRDAQLRRYKYLKNVFSIGPNRINFRIFKKFLFPIFDFLNFFIYSDTTYRALYVTFHLKNHGIGGYTINHRIGGYYFNTYNREGYYIKTTIGGLLYQKYSRGLLYQNYNRGYYIQLYINV